LKANNNKINHCLLLWFHIRFLIVYCDFMFMIYPCLLWFHVYDFSLFIVISCLWFLIVYCDFMFMINHCLLWSHVYDLSLFIVISCLWYIIVDCDFMFMINHCILWFHVYDLSLFIVISCFYGLGLGMFNTTGLPQTTDKLYHRKLYRVLFDLPLITMYIWSSKGYSVFCSGYTVKPI